MNVVAVGNEDAVANAIDTPDGNIDVGMYDMEAMMNKEMADAMAGMGDMGMPMDFAG